MIFSPNYLPSAPCDETDLSMKNNRRSYLDGVFWKVKLLGEFTASRSGHVVFFEELFL